MGKIDKEKLLEEIRNFKFYSNTVYAEIADLINNFPDEPEIDFDALRKECLDGSSDLSIACGINRFYKFLKSKHLTAPQIDMDQLRNEVYSEIVKSKFEIPVNKTGVLKSPDEILKGSQYIEFKNCAYSLSSDDKKIGQRDEVIFPDYCYTDIKEEPDYSAIHGYKADGDSKQHCTQCEIGQQNLELIAEVERLKEIIKEIFVNNLHIFCPSCKEKDCLCMLDSTCEKLRNILDGKE